MLDSAEQMHAGRVLGLGFAPAGLQGAQATGPFRLQMRRVAALSHLRLGVRPGQSGGPLVRALRTTEAGELLPDDCAGAPQLPQA